MFIVYAQLEKGEMRVKDERTTEREVITDDTTF